MSETRQFILFMFCFFAALGGFLAMSEAVQTQIIIKDIAAKIEQAEGR